MPADRARVKELFFEASDLAADEREPFVRAATRGEPELFEEVMRLVRHHDDAPLLTERPPETPAEPDPMGLVGARIGERYVVERFLAEGGFAFVYRALDTRDGSPVALKVLRALDAEQRDRVEAAFRREGELLERLARAEPAFVRIEGQGRCLGPRSQPLLYLVLEWLEGTPLRVPSAGLLLGDLVRKLEPVARALAIAHEAGVAHRDIKPSNLFETPDGALRVLDLGIAKVAEDRSGGFASTASARSAFSTRYAAPEQVLNQATGPWTDVYGLALVCVELLAGRHPYAEMGALETLMAIPDPRRRPDPRSLGVAVSEEVNRVFAAALSTDPPSRPDVRSFWRELSRAAAG